MKKKKEYSNFFRYEFWNLPILFSLGYTNEFNLYHPSIQSAVRMSSVFNTIHILKKNDFDVLGKKFLAAFGKTKEDLIMEGGTYVLHFNEPKLLDKYQKEVSKRIPDGLPPNNNGVILKLRIIENSLFERVMPPANFKFANKFVQHDFENI